MIARRLLATAALFAAATAVFAACGGSSGESGLPSTAAVQTATRAASTPVAPIGTPRPASTGGTTGGDELILPQPAAYFSLLLSDMAAGEFQPNPPETYLVNSTRFALLGQFQNGQVATAAIREWGFIEGWNTQFDPLGQLAAVASGGYYVTVANYLFKDVNGASAAYDSFVAQYTRPTGSQQATVKQLANESAGFTIESGTVGRSNLPNVYHRFLFRRGNMVAVVQVNGAGPYISMDIARDYAVMMDDKALGKRPANLPTPIPTVQVAVPTP